MPSPARIAALMAVLALLVPSTALAQSGGDGGAGDSQYQDPFGTQTQSAKPAKPAAKQQQQPAQQQQQQTTPAPAPAAQSAPTQSAQAQSQPQATAQQGQPAQSLPRTGFDVLPVAAVGFLLLLGGLALWRRPHGER
jgi:LPXTG-motif cell wall-anchored protein